jgi:hypothetical protein
MKRLAITREHGDVVSGTPMVSYRAAEQARALLLALAAQASW